MTASSVDTAELPRARRRAAPAPALVPPAPVASSSAPVVVHPPGRIERRAERRHARRQRQLFTLLGLAVLVAALAATVVVLDVVR